jgi:hypothetical protein
MLPMRTMMQTNMRGVRRMMAKFSSHRSYLNGSVPGLVSFPPQHKLVAI